MDADELRNAFWCIIFANGNFTEDDVRFAKGWADEIEYGLATETNQLVREKILNNVRYGKGLLEAA